MTAENAPRFAEDLCLSPPRPRPPFSSFWSSLTCILGVLGVWCLSPLMLSRACAMLSPPVERAGTGFGGAAGTFREVFPCRTPIWVSSTGPFSGSRVAEPSSAAETGVTLLCSGLRPWFTLSHPGPEARTTCLAAGAKSLQHNLGGWLGVLIPDVFSKWVTLDQRMRTI